MNIIDNMKSGVLPNGKVKVPHPPKPEGRTPVRVNKVEISADAIRAEMQNHRASNPDQAKAEAIRALIVRQLLLDEAAAKNIVAEPEKLGKGLRELEDDAAIRTLLDNEISTPKADVEACRRYYEANMARFSSETIYEAKHILIAAPLSDNIKRAEAKTTAINLIEKLENDISAFGELALEYSSCISKQQGGNLGQLSKGSTVAEFETVLFEMSAGQLWPAPVPTQFGYHIIKLEKIIKGEQLPFDVVHTKIGAWLEAASWSRAVSQYISILAGKADIEGFEMNGAKSPLVQ
ncbi:MAG: peptidylprolyl isomerase [Devosiaceae bacterium]|nr:peptidylprolyl isomerase [Devosiaceae bacterium]